MSKHQDDQEQQQDNQEQDVQQPNKSWLGSPILTRLKGFFKAYAGATLTSWYISSAVATGGISAGVIAGAGVGMTMVGFFTKKLGEKLGWPKTAEFGANLENVGLKTLCAPLYTVAAVADGAVSIWRGVDPEPGKSWVGMINSGTRSVSGIDTVREQNGFRSNDLPSVKAKQEVNHPIDHERRNDLGKNSSVDNVSIGGDDDHSQGTHRHDVRGQGEHRSEPSSIGNDDLVTGIKSARTFEAAKVAYEESIKAEDKFQPVGKPKTNVDGTITVTWMPPGADKKDTHLQVTCTYNRDGSMIGVDAGKQASCILPPIKKNNGFEVTQYKNGKSETIHEVSQKNKSQSIVNATKVNAGSGVNVSSMSRLKKPNTRQL